MKEMRYFKCRKQGYIPIDIDTLCKGQATISD